MPLENWLWGGYQDRRALRRLKKLLPLTFGDVISELVSGLETTWQVMQEVLERYTLSDLHAQVKCGKLATGGRRKGKDTFNIFIEGIHQL